MKNDSVTFKSIAKIRNIKDIENTFRRLNNQISRFMPWDKHLVAKRNAKGKYILQSPTKSEINIIERMS